MDTPAEARDYDNMDHAAVNRRFVDDFLAACPTVDGVVLDVGTGTALIPIELCRRTPRPYVIALDAAGAMIALAIRNVDAAGLTGRVRPTVGTARAVPYPDGHFSAVVCNSLWHHLADPTEAVAEMVRVCRPGGGLFARDLLRPATEADVTHLVTTHAAGATDGQRRLFADSLRAALTLAEVRGIVARFGFGPDSLRRTSDRHWTWETTR